MLTLSYEYKLNPTTEQVHEIEQILTVCRKVGNYALHERKDWIKSRKSPVNACSLVSEYIISPDEPFIARSVKKTNYQFTITHYLLPIT